MFYLNSVRRRTHRGCRFNTEAVILHLLLEQNGSETGVEGTDTLVLEHLAEAANETVGVGGLGDETDTGGLKRAQGNVGEELGGSGGGEVDSSAVVDGVLVADQVDGLLLEELVSTELQGALEEVTGSGRSEAGEKSAGTLVLDDLLETTDHTAVVGGGVELDSGLDAVYLMLAICANWFGYRYGPSLLTVAIEQRASLADCGLALPLSAIWLVKGHAHRPERRFSPSSTEESGKEKTPTHRRE